MARNSSVRASRLRALTALEVLVVLAIIALIGSSMIVAASNIRERAQTLATEATLKLVGLALDQYCNDYHAYPPTTFAELGLTVPEDILPPEPVTEHEDSESLYFCLCASIPGQGLRPYVEFASDILKNDDNDRFQDRPEFPYQVRNQAVFEIVDAWGTPLRYVVPGVNNVTSFDLYSCGSNRVDESGFGDDIANWRK